MSELIIAGFDDAHTAHLVSAVFARLQEEILTEGPGAAVVKRHEDGRITLSEAIDLPSELPDHDAFWRTLAGKIFAALPTPQQAAADPPSDKLLAIGVTAEFLQDVDAAIAPGTSAVLIVFRREELEQIDGILRGFHARLARTQLSGDDPLGWLASLQRR
jgi:uncharacterized membrane protein